MPNKIRLALALLLVLFFSEVGFATITPSQPQNGNGTTDNPFEITSAAELYWLASTVNDGKCASTVNKYVLTDEIGASKVGADGTYKGTAPENVWTPIGNRSRQYTGVFDGDGHTISGVYFNNANKDTVGLFGVLRAGSVKGVGVTDSYIRGRNCVGGIVGFNLSLSNNAVTDVYNAGLVSGNNYVGGIVGGNQGGKFFLLEFLAPFGHDFCCLALDDNVGVGVAYGSFQVEACDFGAAAFGEAFEACRWVDDAACADVGEFVAVLQCVLDFVHVQRRFTEEYDVRAHACAADGAACVHGFLAAEFELVAFFAAEFHQVAVHVQYVLAAAAFVQVIDILRDEQELVAEALFEFCKRNVCCVRLMLRKPFAQKVVEVLDALGVAAECFGRAYVLDIFVFPHAVIAAECAEPGFGADASSSKYDESFSHIFSLCCVILR